MIRNISIDEIKKNNEIKELFINANIKELNTACNIYNGDFYLDSFNYFLINKNYNTFSNLFNRDINLDNGHFYTQKFFESFLNDSKNFKNYNNVFLLGSNAADNYYSNILQFLPRLFFISDKNIKICVHRNSSNKLRNFVTNVMKNQNIKFSFTYLDDNFYSFTNSRFPQFLKLNVSSKVLRYFFKFKEKTNDQKKIYVTREDSSYRKIINEADIIPKLRLNGFKIINPNLYEIYEQIEIFAKADKIIAPYGSNLANIVFCKPGTEILEIGPKFLNSYEKVYEDRYKNLASINNLNYTRFIADTVDAEQHSKFAKKYINKQILQNSNYYKNLIVKLKDFELLLN